jgi:membrane protease YdiL (CAAX protease family)
MPAGLLAGLGRLNLSFIVMILTALLLISADQVYGPETGIRMQVVLLIYVVLLVWIRGDAGHKGEHPEQSIGPAIPLFIAGFVLTYIIFTAFLAAPVTGELLPGLIAASTLEIQASITFVSVLGFGHAFVKAYIEEEVFRSKMMTLLKPVSGKGDGTFMQNVRQELPAALVFGAFHFVVLYAFFGFTASLWVAMGWLSLLGLAWGIAEDRIGIAGSTGSHFAYNLIVFGMLPVLSGAVVV